MRQHVSVILARTDLLTMREPIGLVSPHVTMTNTMPRDHRRRRNLPARRIPFPPLDGTSDYPTFLVAIWDAVGVPWLR